MMNEITVPIYLMTGFLESGKTSVSELYHAAGLFSHRRKNTSDPL